MRVALILSAAAAVALSSAAARADSLGRPCTDKAESEYMSLEALKAKVVEQGYQIRSGEIRKACGEFYVLNKDGKRAELFVDPTSGKIVAGDGKGEVGKAGEREEASEKGEKAGEREEAGDKVGEREEAGEKDGED